VKPARIDLLTSTRFFLAAIVIAFHGAFYLDNAGVTTNPVVYNLVHNGYLAVQFFFVLSGFILTYTYFGADPDGLWIRFAAARLARIYPVYLVGLLAMLPFALRPGYLEPSANEPFPVVAGLQLALLQAWIPKHALSWNAPGWSLSAEVFFYALFPLLLSRIRRIPSTALVLSALAICVLQQGGDWALGKFVSQVYATGNTPLFRLPEFVVGMIAGIICLRHRTVLRTAAPWLAPIAMAICGLGFAAPGIDALQLNNGELSLPAAMLCIGLAARPDAMAFLANGHLVRLGQASYAMYILHYPLSLWLARATRSLGFGASFPGAYFLVYFAMVVFISVLVYVAIEEPMRSAIKRRLRAAGDAKGAFAEREAIADPAP